MHLFFFSFLMSTLDVCLQFMLSKLRIKLKNHTTRGNFRARNTEKVRPVINRRVNNIQPLATKEPCIHLTIHLKKGRSRFFRSLRIKGRQKTQCFSVIIVCLYSLCTCWYMKLQSAPITIIKKQLWVNFTQHYVRTVSIEFHVSFLKICHFSFIFACYF